MIWIPSDAKQQLPDRSHKKKHSVVWYLQVGSTLIITWSASPLYVWRRRNRNPIIKWNTDATYVKWKTESVERADYLTFSYVSLSITNSFVSYCLCFVKHWILHFLHLIPIPGQRYTHNKQIMDTVIARTRMKKPGIVMQNGAASKKQTKSLFADKKTFDLISFVVTAEHRRGQMSLCSRDRPASCIVKFGPTKMTQLHFRRRLSSTNSSP